MAEIALSALLQATFDKLSSAILEELGLFRSVGKDIENLRNSLCIILGVLADAEEKQQTDKGVKIWLKQLKDSSYDADDILDQCATEALRRKLETEGRVVNKACDFFSASNPVLFDLRMVHKIKDIRERLDAIAGNGSKLGLMLTERPLESREETHSHIIESDVKGREEDKEKVVELLLDIDNEEKISVISIVGMGGLGKTSLAQLVYKDVRVEGHFDMRIWVSVSDDFDVRRLTKDILESITGNSYHLEKLELLQRRLREKLSGKKFLLVLDDVWNQDSSKWDSLRSFLLAGETGSKIMVTTRNQEVAFIMGTRRQNLYHLRRLSDEVCWSLFQQRAFGQGREQNQDLVVLRKEIVNKCGGIPLAAKVLGSVMGSKGGEDEWKHVKESEIRNLTENDDSILPVLRLSYNHLPSHLKPCFAYCSIFPKDHHIQVEELIQLWMAEGFIQPSQGKRPMEDIGREYFNNLLSRSFFQDAKKDDVEGNVISCKMHDLMHDIAHSVSEDARSIVPEDGKITILDGCRHLSVQFRGWERVSITLMPSNRAKKLRTLLLLQSGYFIRSRKPFTHLPLCLRVLDLSDARAKKGALNSISGLKQLRYLCLCLSGVRILPNSLSKLHNLQTLKLTECWSLKKLPRDMKKMINLRHLQMDEYVSLTHMPANMGELKFLQTLSVFVVGEESGCNIRELEDLNLGGALKIRKLENIKCGGNAQEAKLSEKANIRSLGLSWSRNSIHSADLNEQSLEGLQPHRNLRCLKVENYCGKRLAQWMSCSFLPNLLRLSLMECRQCEELPSLGQLPLLKFLYVRGMDGVKCIGRDVYEDSAFPSLEEVTLEEMPNLEEWSAWNGGRQVALPRLKSLEVRGCPKLSAVPCFPLLSSLRLSGFEAESLPNCFFQNQLTHLSKLGIEYCQNLESLSRELGNVAATMEELSITYCCKLVSLFPEEMQNYSPCLRRLSIDNCDGLTSLRLQGLTSLTSLLIYDCRELASFADGMEHLTSLTSLHVSTCAKVTHLPEGLKHATRLQSLYLRNLPSLSTLPDWIGNLSSLQELYINDYPNLVSLPSGFQHLINLQNLTIYNYSPQLEKRYEKERGEDGTR